MQLLIASNIKGFVGTCRNRIDELMNATNDADIKHKAKVLNTSPFYKTNIRLINKSWQI